MILQSVNKIPVNNLKKRENKKKLTQNKDNNSSKKKCVSHTVYSVNWLPFSLTESFRQVTNSAIMNSKVIYSLFNVDLLATNERQKLLISTSESERTNEETKKIK